MATARCRSRGRGVAGRLLLAATLAVGSLVQLCAQAKPDDRRAALSARIEATAALLESTRSNRAAALDRLVGLQRQVSQREELVGLLRLEIAHADSSVGRTAAAIAGLERDVATLTEEYGRLVRAALRQNLLESRWAFLLDAGSLGEAFRRVLYLQRYDEQRRRQLELIGATRASLAGKVDRLETVRARKRELLGAELAQRALLAGELAEVDEIVAELRGDASRLRRELRAQRAAREALDEAVADVIVAADAAAEERIASEATGATATAERYTAALAADFAGNRGRLPWPVADGFVSRPFGVQPHPTLARVEINNNGVDIRCAPGAEVRAVFEGEVVGLSEVPGYHNMVVLQHGADYYTVYSNLVAVDVKPGARVGTADVLGEAAVDASTGTSEVHFEVWEGTGARDPGGWVDGL